MQRLQMERNETEPKTDSSTPTPPLFAQKQNEMLLMHACRSRMCVCVKIYNMYINLFAEPHRQSNRKAAPLVATGNTY